MVFIMTINNFSSIDRCLSFAKKRFDKESSLQEKELLNSFVNTLFKSSSLIDPYLMLLHSKSEWVNKSQKEMDHLEKNKKKMEASIESLQKKSIIKNKLLPWTQDSQEKKDLQWKRYEIGKNKAEEGIKNEKRKIRVIEQFVSYVNEEIANETTEDSFFKKTFQKVISFGMASFYYLSLPVTLPGKFFWDQTLGRCFRKPMVEVEKEEERVSKRIFSSPKKLHQTWNLICLKMGFFPGDTGALSFTNKQWAVNWVSEIVKDTELKEERGEGRSLPYSLKMGDQTFQVEIPKDEEKPLIWKEGKMPQKIFKGKEAQEALHRLLSDCLSDKGEYPWVVVEKIFPSQMNSCTIRVDGSFEIEYDKEMNGEGNLEQWKRIPALVPKKFSLSASQRIKGKVDFANREILLEEGNLKVSYCGAGADITKIFLCPNGEEIEVHGRLGGSVKFVAMMLGCEEASKLQLKEKKFRHTFQYLKWK
jgi:hypothetical protein